MLFMIIDIFLSWEVVGVKSVSMCKQGNLKRTLSAGCNIVEYNINFLPNFLDLITRQCPLNTVE